MKTRNTKPLAILFVAILLITSSCFREGITGIRGSGPKVTEGVYVNSFDGIDLRISGDVIITKGDEQEVIIEAQQNILNNIKNYVNGGTWIIEFDRNVRDHDGVTIYITVPEIAELEISGSGSISGNSDFVADDFETKISGSGNINFYINANSIYTQISGSGNVNITGSVDSQDLDISGSGKYYALSCVSDFCYVDISGSGSAEVYVLDRLEANISGSGSVYYKGNPTVYSNISGSGNVNPYNK